MKTRKFSLSLLVVLAFVLTAAVAAAGDFEWMQDLSIRAQADPAGFRAQLAARFQVGDAQIGMILGSVDNPADAYMALRLGEMSGNPVDQVLEQYGAQKGKGWGALAQSLGIKPGSPEFKALKAGHDLNNQQGGHPGEKKNKGKGK